MGFRRALCGFRATYTTRCQLYWQWHRQSGNKKQIKSPRFTPGAVQHKTHAAPQYWPYAGLEAEDGGKSPRRVLAARQRRRGGREAAEELGRKGARRVLLRVEQRRLAAGAEGGERLGAVVEEEGRDGRVVLVAGDDEGREPVVIGLAGSTPGLARSSAVTSA